METGNYYLAMIAMAIIQAIGVFLITKKELFRNTKKHKKNDRMAYIGLIFLFLIGEFSVVLMR